MGRALQPLLRHGQAGRRRALQGRDTAAGRYYAIAPDRGDPTQSQDPEFLEGLGRQTFPFSLAQGDTRTLDLRLFTVQQTLYYESQWYAPLLN